jgi:hypothetical protein
MQTAQAFKDFMEREFLGRPSEAAEYIDKVILLLITKIDMSNLKTIEDRQLFQESCRLLFQLRSMFYQLKPLPRLNT